MTNPYPAHEGWAIIFAKRKEQTRLRLRELGKMYLGRALAISSLVVLAACGDATERRSIDFLPKDSEQFSVAERVAAHRLSVGSGGDLLPQDRAERAATCVTALEWLSERLGSMGNLPADQIASLQSARVLYSRQTGERRAVPVQDSAAEPTNPSTDAQQAVVSIACLKNLTGPGGGSTG